MYRSQWPFPFCSVRSALFPFRQLACAETSDCGGEKPAAGNRARQTAMGRQFVLRKRPRHKALILWGALGLGALAQPAFAQPWERAQSRAEVHRSQAQLHDDIRDLQRFRQALWAFDNAVARRDLMGIRAALNSFVQQGRIEVAEQQRETHQAFREAQRSRHEAYRDRTWKDHRDAIDDQRDARSEQIELQQEIAALNELERAASAQYTFGPGPGILARARDAMVRFVQLAEIEVRKSHRELREDLRELREDQRYPYRGYPRRGPVPPPPGYAPGPPRPVYGTPAPVGPAPYTAAPVAPTGPRPSPYGTAAPVAPTGPAAPNPAYGL